MNTHDTGHPHLELSRIGLGCMGMSEFYGPAERVESIATIHAALDAGTFLLDTGDFYGSGHNELLIAEALKGRRREDVFIAVKFGAMRSPSGDFIGIDTRPQAVKNSLAYTLRRLGTDYVDLYQPARVDPEVAIEETVGAIGEMVDAGLVRHIGLSEAAPDTIRRANDTRPVSWLQIEYSLLSRGIEAEILPLCRELGITVSVYGVLSRGLLSGRWPAARTHSDFRDNLPRFQGANLMRNLALVGQLEEIAQERNASIAQIAIAWVLAQGNDIIPLIGARSRERLEESLTATAIDLTDSDIRRISAAFPEGVAHGDRYNAEQTALLDSERT